MNRLCCARRRNRPRPLSASSTNPVAGDGYYDNSACFIPPQAYQNMPLSPPPPYDRIDDFVNAFPPNNVYQQRYQSEADLTPTQPKTLRKKKSALASTTDLPRSQRHQQCPQELPSQDTTNLRPLPSRRAFNECPITRTMIQAAAGCDAIAERLHDLLCRTDGADRNDKEVEALTRDLCLEDTRYVLPSNAQERSAAQGQEQERSRAGIINIQKSWMYSNSRLRKHMMPYKVYVPTWQVFCKAASASTDVYKRPRRGEKEDYIAANWRQGTKAMVLKSQPVDHENMIVIAVRGSQWNVMDWAVNFTVEPVSPAGFLDDEGNACHEGFLQVARSMIVPVAARIRQLLEQNPSRASSSLLFTGHSAGGAVANLLYVHMHSKTVSSALTAFNGVFKRVHCVTFGVPPISLLPLENPKGQEYVRNQFVSFVNEGDPIVRADLSYMKSLVKLYATHAPKLPASDGHGLRSKVPRQALREQAAAVKHTKAPRWPVPAATLSNAGRMVLLREKPGHSASVEATYVTDKELRDVVFGDPVMHHMEVYQRRVESLAIASLTGREK